MLKNLVILSALSLPILALDGQARACPCSVSVAGDLAGAVDATVQARVAAADSMYAKMDFDGALDVYADVYADVSAEVKGNAGAMATISVLLYAEARCQAELGMAADAKENFQAYLDALASAGGSVGAAAAYKAIAEAALEDPDAGAIMVASMADLKSDIEGGVGGAVGAGVGGALGAAGGVRGEVGKKTKVAGTAAMVVGVVAIAALVVVGGYGITAGISDDIDFDKGFGVGFGVAGVSLGITALYMASLTTAVGAAGAVHCANPPRHALAPVILPDGAGVAGYISF